MVALEEKAVSVDQKWQRGSAAPIKVALEAMFISIGDHSRLPKTNGGLDPGLVASGCLSRTFSQLTIREIVQRLYVGSP